MSYQIMRVGLIFFLTAYAVLGFLTRFHTRHELYPFFSWKLFDTVPNVRTEYFIKITSLGNTPVSPSQYYLDRKDIISPLSSSASLIQRKIIDLVRSYKEGNEKGMKQGKRAIENSFIIPISYEVVETRFIPLQFLKNRSIVQEKTLFTVNQDPL